MKLAAEAMLFAGEVHKDQRRKYTNEPYVNHLAAVVGISMSVGRDYLLVHPEVFMAVGWLHDSVEDQGLCEEDLRSRFGQEVADGVFLLSDLEQGNRKSRKLASMDRLSAAPSWVQTIKVADLISNTSSIVQYDPEFAIVYLEEKRLLLDELKLADPTLLKIARSQCRQ